MAFRITHVETFQFFYLCCWFSKTATNYILKGISFFIRALAFKEWRGLHFYSSIHRMPAWVQSIFHIDFNEVRGWNWKMRGRMKISTCLLLWCANDHLQTAVMFLSFEKNISVAIWTFHMAHKNKEKVSDLLIKNHCWAGKKIECLHLILRESNINLFY